MLRVRTELTGWSGGPGLLTSYFTTPNQDTPAAIRAQGYVHDLFGSVYGQIMSNQVTWKVLPDVDVVTAGSGAVTNVLSDSAAHTSTGGGGSDMVSPSTAALVRWNTADWVGGRHIRGRSYVSPVADLSSNAQGEMVAADKTAVDAALVTWIASWDAGDFGVIWHRPIGGTGGSVHQIISGEVRTKFGVLTSRRD